MRGTRRTRRYSFTRATLIPGWIPSTAPGTCASRLTARCLRRPLGRCCFTKPAFRRATTSPSWMPAWISSSRPIRLLTAPTRETRATGRRGLATRRTGTSSGATPVRSRRFPRSRIYCASITRRSISTSMGCSRSGLSRPFPNGVDPLAARVLRLGYDVGWNGDRLTVRLCGQVFADLRTENRARRFADAIVFRPGDGGRAASVSLSGGVVDDGEDGSARAGAAIVSEGGGNGTAATHSALSARFGGHDFKTGRRTRVGKDAIHRADDGGHGGEQRGGTGNAGDDVPTGFGLAGGGVQDGLEWSLR